jgi:hypothetical protein
MEGYSAITSIETPSGNPPAWLVPGTARNAIANEAAAMNRLDKRNMSFSLE